MIAEVSMDKVLEHLKMIEGVIDRLGHNSFALKGWSITITTALFAFAGIRENTIFLWIGLIPIGFFWILDSYYLWLERKFRKLYDRVRIDKYTDFNMSIKGIKICFPIFRPAEWLYYIPQIALLVLFAIWRRPCV